MSVLLVTGGSGFIGSNFIRYWLGRYPRDRIINLDALTYAANPENLRGCEDLGDYRFVRGDVCDAPVVDAVFKAHAPDHVVHFAAQTHVDRAVRDPGLFVRTNVLGTSTLLECARRHWTEEASGRRFLQVSTDEVYGSLAADQAPASESSPCLPSSPYSASKAGADHLVRSYFLTFGLPVLTTRCSNNYGPRQFPEKLIPLLITRALSWQALPLYGDGGNIRDWLHVDDHCRGIEAALLRGRTGETYNLGGGNQQRNIDIARIVCDRLDVVRPAGRSHHELITFVADRPGHDRRYALDLRRSREELQWSAQVDFINGLHRTIDWYLENPSWWRAPGDPSGGS